MGCSCSVPSPGQQMGVEAMVALGPAKKVIGKTADLPSIARHPTNSSDAAKKQAAPAAIFSKAATSAPATSSSEIPNKDMPEGPSVKRNCEAPNAKMKAYFIDAGRSSGAWRQESLNNTASAARDMANKSSAECSEALTENDSIDSVYEQDLVDVEDDSSGGLMASLHTGHSDMDSLKESPLNRGTSTRKLPTNRLSQSDEDVDESKMSFVLDSSKGPSMPEGLNSSRSGAGHKRAGMVRDCPLAAELIDAGLDDLVRVLVEGLGLWTPAELLNLELGGAWMDRGLTEVEHAAVVHAKEAFADRNVALYQRTLAPFELNETLLEVLTARGMEVLEEELSRMCQGSVEGLAQLQVISHCRHFSAYSLNFRVISP